LDFSICEFSSGSDERLIKLAYVRSSREDRYSPIHRHNFDQVRYVVSGEIEYGPLKCRPGDCVYFPEGVFYGPTRVLSEKAENYTVQSQGPSRAYLLSRAEAKKAAAEISQEAQLDRDRGVVRWSNGKTQDSYEAMWEKVTGDKIVYPSARYNGPCLIRSEEFSWNDWNRGEGTSIKHLALFNECGPAIKILRIETGGKLFAGRTNCHRIALVLSGSIAENGTRLSEGAALYSPPHAEYPEIACAAEATLLFVYLQDLNGPTVDSWIP
jgi:mannose-6-phosphate isomerase-like protein (cupin superfamily)